MITQISTGKPAFLNFTATTEPTPLPDRKAVLVEIVNDTEKDLYLDRGANTATACLKQGNAHVFKIASSTKELRIWVTEGDATPGIIEYWG